MFVSELWEALGFEDDRRAKPDVGGHVRAAA